MMSQINRVLLLVLLWLPLQFMQVVEASASPFTDQATSEFHSIFHLHKDQKHCKDDIVSCDIEAHCLQHCVSPLISNLDVTVSTNFGAVWQSTTPKQLRSITHAPPHHPPQA